MDQNRLVKRLISVTFQVVPLRKLQLLPLVLLFPLSVWAQGLSLSTIYVFGDLKQVDLSELNEALNTTQDRYFYPTFDDVSYASGFGVRLGDASLRFGLEHRVAQANGENAPTQTNRTVVGKGKISSAQTLLDASYGLIRMGGARLVIAPTVGFGYERLTLAYRLDETRDASFEDLLSNPGQKFQLRRHQFLLDFALQADYALSYEGEYDEIGWILTFRVGYTLAPFGTGWREIVEGLDNQGIDGGPDVTLGGLYVRVGVGL